MPEFDKEYRISQLIAGKLAGSLTEAEEEELTRWRLTSGENGEEARLYQYITDPQQQKEREILVNEVNLPAVWAEVGKFVVPTSSRRIRLRWISAITAAAVLFAGLFLIYFLTEEPSGDHMSLATVETGSSKAYLLTPDGGYIPLVQPGQKDSLLRVDNAYVFTTAKKADYFITRDSFQGIELQTLCVPRGGEYELVLSDKTHVWLNSDSEIRFPACFRGGVREIFLKGEAYFEVAPDSLSPFIIHTADKLAVEVLGTSFNVQAYPGDEYITTTLASGSVRVSDGKREVLLSPNQQALYHISEGSLNTRHVNASIYSAWKDGLFIFENQPLESILNTLARWYDLEVDIQKHSLDNYHFTGDLERYTNFRKTLEMIEKTTPGIRFIINGKKITIEKMLTP